MSSSPPLVVADRYRLVAPLGQGGMGRVWRATDVVLHREVAIKELVPPPGLTAGERQEMRERSLREARAIARLNNINVVRVFDVLRTDADPWIVMEYVPSRSLQDTLAADGPFNPLRAAEIGLGVLGALRAAHRAGVVHRDVKPGNVLIGEDGRVVLTDFGLATVPGDPNVTRTGLVLGSPAYIAPERARDGTAGPAADLWSLGATLYAAVEGASPFARPSAIATLTALATENPPPARNAGPLKPVLNGLLRKDPTHRINLDEAERLLLRASGRRSKLSFPMSPTMRRPGVGRERPAMTGSAPVVPGPRPPVVPARPVSPPGQPPVVPGGRPAVGEGRPPVFVPGKAPVGRPSPDTPTRVDGPKVDAPRLDATRVDGPPVRDDKTTKIGTPPGAPTAAGPSTTRGPARPTADEARPGRGTAADRRGKKATPDAVTDATTVVSPAPAARRGSAPAQPVTGDASAKPAAEAGTAVTPAKAGGTPAQPRPGAAASGAAKSKAARPGAAKSAATSSGVAPAAPTKSEAAKSAAGQSGSSAVQSGPAKSETAEPEAAQSGSDAIPADPAKSETAEPQSAQSETGSGAAQAEAGSGAVQAEAGSDAVQAETGSDAAQAKAAQSGAASSATRTAGSTKPKTDAARSKPTSPAPAAAADPSPAEPEPAKPDATEPDAAKSGATQPEAAAPGATEPKPDEAEAPTSPAAADPVEDPDALKTTLLETTQPKAAPAQSKRKPAPAAEQPAEAVKPDAESKAADGDKTSVLGGPRLPLAHPVASDRIDDPAPVSPVAAIGRPSRPAWQPMEVRPSGPGVTVFGTRLTYRQASIGAGLLLLVLILVIALVAQAVGDGDKGTPGTNPDAAPTAGTSGPGTPSTAPPSSAAPSSPAPSSPAAFTLPAGWEMVKVEAGSGLPAFTVPLPKGVARRGPSNNLEFKWNNRLLLVGRTTSPQPDAYKDWVQQEAARRGSIRGYDRVRIDRLKSWRGFPSVADWEYFYTTDSGNRQHVIRRNFVVNGKAAFSLNWYASPDDWAASLNDLNVIYQGFQPK